MHARGSKHQFIKTDIVDAFFEVSQLGIARKTNCQMNLSRLNGRSVHVNKINCERFGSGLQRFQGSTPELRVQLAEALY
ncbi:hypothetical protein M514_19052 [Trichuris suis]|uniref:Uncharacterized protein n=1 Tax=Trichuris suis TaxID=68888 RepID=A0A085NH65_9BILA|nr:hypothetical protein M514_19052 [Trichuris suis]